ncbi:MAG TPA: M20/M25/M40 family metallo-hydrolase [Candidatus Bilamarchaeaceae archaeon]|nr:M20/M25/M40 family metallo-hydrolase [Candidatus Bilamarchaeaceae archaeon]
MGLIRNIGMKFLGFLKKIAKRNRTYAEQQTILHLANLVQFKTSVDVENYTIEMKKCADYLEQVLSKAGLKTKRYKKNELETVVGYIGNDAGETIIFNGHYDVVLDSDGWNDFTLTEGEYEKEMVYFGKGVYDMKGSIAAMLGAMECCETGKFKKNRLMFMFVPNEEIGGKEGTAYALNEMIRDGVLYPKMTKAIVGESTELDITTRRRAHYLFEIKIPMDKKRKKLLGRTYIGQSLHTSEFSIEQFREGKLKHPLFSIAQDYVNQKISGISGIELGYLQQGKIIESPSNVLPKHARVWFDGTDETDPAIDKLLRFMEKLERFEFESEKSNYGTSISCNRLMYDKDQMRFYLDIRIMEDDLERIEEYIRNVAKSRDIEDIKVLNVKRSLKSDGDWPDELEKIVKRVYKKSKKGKENKGQSDSSYFVEHSIPVVEIGPAGGNDHKCYEHVNEKSLYELVVIYQKIIENKLN